MRQQDILQRLFTFDGDEANDYFCVDTVCDRNLNVRGIYYVRLGADGKLPDDWQHRFRYTSRLGPVRPYEEGDGALAGPYAPANSLPTLDTIVPDNMDEETREALSNLRNAIGGDVEGFVCAKLRMPPDELARCLKAEQVDSVALAVYNIEARGQGIIIGDQTGVGKGRQAAAIIRYALRQGLTPVFITARANLFSDIYRDCKALGIADAKPLIVNSGATVVDTALQRADYEEPVQGEDETDADFDLRLMKAQAHAYETVYASDKAQDFKTRGALPQGYDYVMATYSQFNARKSAKKEWLKELAARQGCVFILDEAHAAAGANSNTGEYFRDLLTLAAGAVFLSATFAKRPDNMGLYATKTLIGQCGASGDQLIDILAKGGAPLQEVLASNLVRAGQMVRRERSMENVVVRYITLDERGNKEFGVPNTSSQDRANSDAVTAIMRQLVTLHTKIKNHAGTLRDEDEVRLIKEARKAGKLEGRPTFSTETVSPQESLFPIVESLLLATKAESVARRAAQHVAEGRKVVICVAKTKEGVMRTLLDDADGGEVDGSFRSLLAGIYRRMLSVRICIKTTEKGFADIARRHGYSLVDAHDGTVFDLQRLVDLNAEAAPLFPGPGGAEDARGAIEALTAPLPLSPIDFMRHILKTEGVASGECTGRTMRLQYEDGDVTRATVESIPRSNVTATYARFQDNEIDVMFVNQAGATGASCHAVPTAKVPPEEVKQRVMIIAQPELDVTQEMQKRGRINRTGQLPNLPPIYEYVSTSIPAERRMLMMLKRKLKSLDANTSSDQRQNDTMLDIPDFFNMYGDRAAEKWMSDHSKQCAEIGLSMRSNARKDLRSLITGLSRTASARVAMLCCDDQDEFYRYMQERCDELIEEAKDNGSYNLECEYRNLKAKCTSSQIVRLGDRTKNFFSGASILRKYAYQVEAGYAFSTALEHFTRNRGKIVQVLKNAIEQELKDHHGYETDLCSSCRALLESAEKGLPPMFVINSRPWYKAAIVVNVELPQKGRYSIDVDVDFTDRHYSKKRYVLSWDHICRHTSLAECEALWERYRALNSSKSLDVVEGNILALLAQTDARRSYTPAVWKFSTDKGEIVTGVHVSGMDLDSMDTNEDPEQPDPGDDTLWPRLEWDATQIPKSRKPIELSNDAKEAEQKHKEMDEILETSRQVLDAAIELPSRIAEKRKCYEKLLEDAQERGETRAQWRMPLHVNVKKLKIPTGEIEPHLYSILYLYGVYFYNFIGEDHMQQITENNFDVDFWPYVFRELGIPHLEHSEEFHIILYEAFNTPGHAEARRNFVEAANLMRDTEAYLRAEVERAERKTAKATEGNETAKAAKKRDATAEAPHSETKPGKDKPKAAKTKAAKTKAAEPKAKAKRLEAELVTSADALHNVLARYVALDGKTINDATVRSALAILQQVQKAIFSRRVRKDTEIGGLFHRAQSNLLQIADPDNKGAVIEIGDKAAFARYARKEKTADPAAKRLIMQFIKIATKPRGAVSDGDKEELEKIRAYKPARDLKEWEAMHKAISDFLAGKRKVLAYPQELSGLWGLAGI